MSARRSLGAALIAGMLAMACSAAFAQQWPTRPLRLVIAFPPGGPADLIGRDIARGLSASIGQPVVVDNRPGGNANIGAEIAAQAAPDGYTLLLLTSTHAANASLYRSLRYDVLRDFSPVARLAGFPLVMVARPSLKVTSTQELIALAMQKPGSLTYASAGSGGGAHLAAESFKGQAGVDMMHVPYKGTGPAVAALLSGQVDLMFASVPAVTGHIASKKITALGVTSARRTAALPQVPTLAEAGLQRFELVSWFGLVAPAGVAATIVSKLNAEANRILGGPAFAKRLEAEGGEGLPGTPEEFGRFIRSEIGRWGEVVRRSRAQVD